MIRFLADCLYFARHWVPFRIKWNSPRFCWKCARGRHSVKELLMRKRELSLLLKRNVLNQEIK